MRLLNVFSIYLGPPDPCLDLHITLRPPLSFPPSPPHNAFLRGNPVTRLPNLSRILCLRHENKPCSFDMPANFYVTPSDFKVCLFFRFWEGIYVLYTYAAKRTTSQKVQKHLSTPIVGGEANVLRHMTFRTS